MPIWPQEERYAEAYVVALPGGGFVSSWARDSGDFEPDLQRALIEASITTAGQAWGAPQLLDGNADYYTTLQVLTARGRHIIAKYYGGGGDARTVAYSEGSWSAPQPAVPGNLAATPAGFSTTWVSVALVDGDDSGDALVRRSSLDGRTWDVAGAPVALPEDSYPFFGMATGTRDVQILVSTPAGGRSVRLTAVGAAQVTALTGLDQTAAPRQLYVVARPEGGFVGFASSIGPGVPLVVGFRNASGTWSQFNKVADTSLFVYFPELDVATAGGTTTLVWTDVHDMEDGSVTGVVRSVELQDPLLKIKGH